MSAVEDDTELRDLLIQTLENSGVLNKLKAELRAAVFLAMEEQDKLEKKPTLINENLKKCLNTKDGRLVASLILDFLQVFHLDFTLSVFQPEINFLNGLEGRDMVCRELSLSPSEINRNSPLLLELVRRTRHSEVLIEQEKVGVNSKVVLDPHERSYPEERPGPVVLSKDLDLVTSLVKGKLQCQQDSKASEVSNDRMSSPAVKKEGLGLDLELENDHHDGDSFFDDPLPKPQKTYGWKVEMSWDRESPAGSLSESHRPTGGGSVSEQSRSRTGLIHKDDNIEYDEDFNSHRSDLSKSEVSIGEEIEEVSFEGHNNSDKFEETTQDVSISQLSHSHGADYMEEVA